MSVLERMNDWCGEVMNKLIRYDDLITFVTITILFLMAIICLVVGILGGLGFLK